VTLTFQGDEYDVYDGPRSPKRLKNWQPRVSQNTSASSNTIHVSTPDRSTELSERRDTRRFTQQQATPRIKTPYLNLIHDALGAQPGKDLSLEEILKWIYTNHREVHDEYGPGKLRASLRTSLDRQAKKVESKRTVWEYEGGTYRLHNPVVAVVEDEESVDTYTERHARTQSMSVPSSIGGRTFDGILEPCENRALPELRQTREQCHADSRDSLPASASQVRNESRLATTESQPSHQSSKADTRIENENLASDEIALSATTAVHNSSHPNETLVQNEPAARSIPVTLNNEPTDTEECRGPADSCDHPGQYGKTKPDYGQIVLDLQQLKQERKMLEQKIEAGHNSLPDVGILTQSASDAQRAADEAKRIADEAQCAAETAKKALEDAEAKQSQLAADKLYYEKLTEDSICLRAQLDID
jgi:hypothetical protein